MALFNEFQKSTYDDWLSQIKNDLKTDNPDRTIFRKIEGMNIPAFLSAGQQEIIHNPIQFRALHHPDFAFSNEWETCVNIATDKPAEANKKALELLKHGASSLRFTGIGISNQEELMLLFRDIQPEILSIHFDCQEASPSLLFIYHDEICRRGLDISSIRGSLGYDPLGDFALNGFFSPNKQELFSILRSLVSFQAENMPSFKVLTLHGSLWHNAGASAIQELAFMISAMSDYLVASEKPEALAKSTILRMAGGGDYYLNIAKFRSIRLLWNRLLRGFGLDAVSIPPYLSTETSLRNKTIFDPYNNLLRATSETMAAIIGGTDEHTVHPHDVVFHEPEVESQRLGLNIQHILKYESHFDKVSDPASGSYYLENLTNELTNAAWELFLETEKSGGFVASLEKGFIQEKVEASRMEIEKATRTRKRTITGITHFANPSEKGLEELMIPRDPLGKLPEIKPMKPLREIAYFEDIPRIF